MIDVNKIKSVKVYFKNQDTLRAKNIVMNILLNLKMLPAFVNLDFEKFLNYLKELKEEDLLDLFLNSIEFIKLSDDDYSFLLKNTYFNEKNFDDEDIKKTDINDLIIRLISIIKYVFDNFIILKDENLEEKINKIEVFDLKGLEGLKIFNIVNNVLLNIKMLPKFVNNFYEDFLENLRSFSNRDLIYFLSRNISFVNFDELKKLVAFTFENKEKISKERINGMSVFELENRIIAVILKVLNIDIYFFKEEDKKKLKKYSVNLFDEVINLKGQNFTIEELINFALFSELKKEEYNEFLKNKNRNENII